MNNQNSLVELYNQAGLLEKSILENNGELTPEIEAALMNVETAVAEKLDGYAYVIDRMKASEEFWKARAETLLKVARSCQLVQARIKERLKYVMAANNQVVCEGNEVRFRLTPTKGRLVIGDEEAIPVAFKTEVTVWEVNKEAVRKEVEAGQTVPGAWLEAGHQLRITIKKGI